MQTVGENPDCLMKPINFGIMKFLGQSIFKLLIKMLQEYGIIIITKTALICLWFKKKIKNYSFKSLIFIIIINAIIWFKSLTMRLLSWRFKNIDLNLFITFKILFEQIFYLFI